MKIRSILRKGLKSSALFTGSSERCRMIDLNWCEIFGPLLRARIKRIKQPRENNLTAMLAFPRRTRAKPRKWLSRMQISCIPVSSKLRFSYNFPAGSINRLWNPHAPAAAVRPMLDWARWARSLINRIPGQRITIDSYMKVEIGNDSYRTRAFQPRGNIAALLVNGKTVRQ